MKKRIFNNLLIIFSLFFLASLCNNIGIITTYKMNYQRLKSVKKLNLFFTKSRVCLKQSVIASEVIFPELVTDMEDLTDLLEERVNQNKIANEMAWKLF